MAAEIGYYECMGKIRNSVPEIKTITLTLPTTCLVDDWTIRLIPTYHYPHPI